MSVRVCRYCGVNECGNPACERQLKMDLEAMGANPVNQRFCPCGGIILADTEDWTIPLCCGCWEDMGCPGNEPRCMPALAGLQTKLDTAVKALIAYGKCTPYHDYEEPKLRSVAETNKGTIVAAICEARLLAREALARGIDDVIKSP